MNRWKEDLRFDGLRWKLGAEVAEVGGFRITTEPN